MLVADVNDLNPDKNERPTPEQVISDGNDHCVFLEKMLKM